MIPDGRYRLWQPRDPADLARVQRFRAECFGLAAPDSDPHDATSHHLLIEETASGRLVCCFRLRSCRGRGVSEGYAGRFYDLHRLETYPGAMLELGRFCILPGLRDPDVLRLAWAAITRLVDEGDVRLLFGCASFAGLEPSRYGDAFALLRARHLAPSRWRPAPLAPDIVPFTDAPQGTDAPGRALRQMPPLLRSYLGMGGWVSDHAVIDRAMGTLHVFTGVEVARIPAARKALLRRLAAQDGPAAQAPRPNRPAADKAGIDGGR